MSNNPFKSQSKVTVTFFSENKARSKSKKYKSKKVKTQAEKTYFSTLVLLNIFEQKVRISKSTKV